MGDVEKLTAGKVFEGCTKRERKQLDRLSTLIQLPAGTALTRQGGRAREFGVIIEGTATVYVDGAAVAHLGAGDHFGEVALLDRAGMKAGRRIATVIADDDLWVALCTAQELGGVLDAVPWVTDRLLTIAADRIAEVPVARPTRVDA